MMIFILTFLISLLTLLNFQAQGVVGVDSGDMVTASVVGGVAHPPGYPLYTIIGHLLSHIPLLTPAWRVGLLSSIPSAMAIALVFIIIKYITSKTIPALIGSFLVLGNYILFLYAVVPEVFGLYNFFLTIIIFITLKWFNKPSIKLLIILGFVIGLSLTHHHLIILIFPAIGYLFYLRKSVFDVKNIILTGFSFLMGLIPYYYIILAARKLPIINWGNVTDLKSFIALITRSQYGTYFSSALFGTSLNERLINVKFFFQMYTNDITWFGVILILFGIYHLYRNNKQLAIFFILLFLFTGPLFFFYASFPVVNYFSASVVERFMAQSYLISYILGGIGIFKVSELIYQRKNTYSRDLVVVSWYLLCGLFLFLTVSTQILRFKGLATDMTANYLGIDNLDTTAKNSILLLSGDTQLFTTQYIRYALHYRSDVIMLPLNSLINSNAYPSIRKNYPDLIFPDPTDDTPVITFFTRNISSRQIYSNTRYNVPGIITVPYGLLFEYMLENNLPTESEYLAKNDQIWANYHIKNIKSGILNRYHHIVIYDVLTKYAERRSEYAETLLGLGEYDKALGVANDAIELSGDFGMPQAYSVKGMIYFAMQKCPESIANLETSLKLNPAFDELVAKELLMVYQECNGSQAKIDKIQQSYNDYLIRKGVKLEKL
jgi:tetratricopeptide (TPR) repeat protein